MEDDILDWDAFEQLQKRRAFQIPEGTVSITKDKINLRNFARHFNKFPRVDVFHQPNAILVVPSEDERAYSFRENHFSASGVVRKFRIETGYYPAKWVEGKGLLIDLTTTPKSSPLGDVLDD